MDVGLSSIMVVWALLLLPPSASASAPHLARRNGTSRADNSQVSKCIPSSARPIAVAQAGDASPNLTYGATLSPASLTIVLHENALIKWNGL